MAVMVSALLTLATLGCDGGGESRGAPDIDESPFIHEPTGMAFQRYITVESPERGRSMSLEISEAGPTQRRPGQVDVAYHSVGARVTIVAHIIPPDGEPDSDLTVEDDRVFEHFQAQKRAIEGGGSQQLHADLGRARISGAATEPRPLLERAEAPLAWNARYSGQYPGGFSMGELITTVAHGHIIAIGLDYDGDDPSVEAARTLRDAFMDMLIEQIESPDGEAASGQTTPDDEVEDAGE